MLRIRGFIEDVRLSVASKFRTEIKCKIEWGYYVKLMSEVKVMIVVCAHHLGEFYS